MKKTVYVVSLYSSIIIYHYEIKKRERERERERERGGMINVIK